jgi:UDP-glucose 4-epimerase
MLGAVTDYLITGVSGALGGRVLAGLAGAGAQRIVGVDMRPLQTSAPGLRYLHEDLGSVDLDAALDGVSVVVHLANRSGAANLRRLLDACARTNVTSIVLLSSAAVMGAWPTNPVPMTEHAVLRPNTGFAYAVDLAEQERIAQEWRESHPHIHVAVLRLAMIVGGGFERALSSALGGMEAHRHIDSSRPVQFLHIDDATSAILFAAANSLDGVFNVAPDGFVSDVTAREIVGTLPKPGLPRRVAYVANHLTWRVRYRTDFSAAHPYLEYPWILANDALRARGWRPRYSTEEALIADVSPGPLVRFGVRERRRAVASAIIGSGVALTAAATAGAALAIATLVRRRR